MKRAIIIILCFFFFITTYSQNIKYISMFDGDTYNNTGVYGATDSVVYRYSYYYDEWFPLSVTGLPVISGNINIKDLAVADTGTSYTSGIYIIADTAVFNYNWYSQEWYPLSNNGLIRINDTVQLSKISVFGKGSSTNQSIFCVSDTCVFKYEWYYPKWFAFYNTGLYVKAQNNNSFELQIKTFPNPFNETTNIELELENSYTGDVEIAVFDLNGKLVLVDNFDVFALNKIEYKLSNTFPNGIYFCEIIAGNTKAIATLVAK